MIKVWTKRELAQALELRLQGRKWAEIAEILKRSESALWVKLSKLAIKVGTDGLDEKAAREHLLTIHRELLEAALEEDLLAEEAANLEDLGDGPEKERVAKTIEKNLAETTIAEDLKASRYRMELEEARESKRKYLEVLGQRAMEDRIVDAFRDRIEAFAPSVQAPRPAFGSLVKIGKRPESAVVVISDTHIGQVVSTSQTNGFGHYDPRIFCERLHYLQENILEVISQTPGGIDELVVLILGDIIHGALHHGAEREDHAAVADQFQLAVWTLHQFLCALAFRVPVVHIHTVVGNHGRWPGQKKMPTNYRYSNLDHLVYASLQLSLKVHGLTNIHLHLNDAARQVVDIKGSRFICQHGDMIRGGDKQFGIPVHGMTRDVNATLQRFAASDERPIDYFIMGDKHKSMSLPLARGEYIVNGSMVGSDEFSMSFCPAEPMQLLFGVHEKLRKTWTYPIKVGHAPALSSCPYHLPDQVLHLVEGSERKAAA